jgi:hypothetical protein
VSEDDRAVMERLAALELEVKADADAQRVRKDAAQAKVREQRAAQEAERAELRARQAALVSKKQRPAPPHDDDDADRGSDLGGALELATKASRVRNELTKTPKQGDKSWVKSGVASMLLGPIGWLYAGSMREAVPASAAWLAFAALASKMIPMFLLFPVLLVALPLSGIAGLLYAVQYNRTGTRQRLFGDKDKKKQLKSG